ncbi:hypothetical protein EYZ11_000444 [Aspergillus tanneri]|uniref:Aflatoxin regulatory protein domain-containing protein n=1 Tax=Aspergillus tanneri TaxID=1220188 RepID=A0A4S3JX74_9EURO|nr:hypothetical protein EYZ11_000444 [Aspergillus tanneri]
MKRETLQIFQFDHTISTITPEYGTHTNSVIADDDCGGPTSHIFTNSKTQGFFPARRIGRPFRSKELTSAEKHGKESEQPPSTRAVKTTRFVDEGDRLFSRFNASSTHVDVGRNSAIANLRPDRHNVSLGAQRPEYNVTGKHWHKVDPDCMLVTMDLFSELEIPAEQLRRSSSVDSSLLNTTTQAISAALRRLFTILICPCSERAEIGMFISALCMTIIDMHAMTIAKCARNKSPPAVLDQTGFWDDHGVAAQEAPENEAMAMQVLGELSKVAKLVLQFTERYSANASGKQALLEGNDIPLDFLPALGNFMRERLQQITNDATYWLG